mmetsp:Transcript_74971/g.243632  ORF Transcript_74971/g.243632 Transcript_74971/m.243632 type:complete len:124 (+) Transcript_74971:275-646(+)
MQFPTSAPSPLAPRCAQASTRATIGQMRGNPLPVLRQLLTTCAPAFLPMVKKLCKRFFRVYAHAYIHHFEDFQHFGGEAHLNCSFKHFLYFVLEFDLVDRDTMQPLSGLVKKFLEQDQSKGGR